MDRFIDTHLLRKKYLKAREVARLIGRSEEVVRYLLRTGKLPGCKLGSTWVIPTAKLFEWFRFLLSATTRKSWNFRDLAREQLPRRQLKKTRVQLPLSVRRYVWKTLKELEAGKMPVNEVEDKKE